MSHPNLVSKKSLKNLYALYSVHTQKLVHIHCMIADHIVLAVVMTTCLFVLLLVIYAVSLLSVLEYCCI